MLTRLEVQGFKNLADVTIEFGPFTCIAGPNGAGKSNVFDVIEFLSALASGTFVEATKGIRGVAEAGSPDPRALFWNGYGPSLQPISLAAEMLVPACVEDDLGAPAEATTTFLRYALKLGYEAPVGPAGIGRMSLMEESLTHITQGEAHGHLRFKHSAKNFRRSVVTGHRSGVAYLSTELREGGMVINIHGDGGSRGRPQPRAAANSGRTVLSTVTTNDNPTILAARREMQNWRKLALEPSALRAPDSFGSPTHLDATGRHLAATLFRIANSDAETTPESVYASIANRLSSLDGVNIVGVDVEADEARDTFTLFATDTDGLRLPARALSEGTLRFLALCVLLEDTDESGLICMEEPENGIHPANVSTMMELVHDLAVDPTVKPGPDNPFRQVIVNTHSPVVVALCKPEDLLLARTHLARMNGPASPVRSVRALDLLPYKGSWRADRQEGFFDELDVISYLVPPMDVQMQLPFDMLWRAS